ncbi:10984_t:CDS:2 [Ambispora gerdemannii]|uniref:10984_t:CDS:1 n=1 Tax=Ambispora gerdemannii TaxID=144530 RepID=A0A9N9GHK8_9GLOM|nr:10984_t:CDS:2 [Ambispora gerdemannii]
MSFITERLNRELDVLFQLESSKSEPQVAYAQLRLQNQAENTSIDAAASSTQEAPIQNVTLARSRTAAIYHAFKVLSFDKGNVPKLSTVLSTLNDVEKILHVRWSYNNSTDSTQELEFEKGIVQLEKLFLAKVCLAIYANVLESVLNATLLLSEDIYYWEELHADRIWQLDMLISLMEHQATCLGLLIKEFKIADHEDSDEEMDADGVISMQLTKCLVLMESVLNQTNNFDIDSGKVPDVNQILCLKYPPKSPSTFSLYIHLSAIITTHLPNHLKQSHKINLKYGRPGFWTRWWLPILGSCILAFKLRKSIYAHREDIRDWINNAKITILHFWTDYVWEPVLKIIDTIQHKERRLAIMGNESLHSDLESLERMVVEFAREKYHMTPAELAVLLSNLRDGDLSLILMAQEDQMKIQKTKVDIELAMAALDKLLKSNELNFAFLAVGPSIFIVYKITSWTGARLIWGHDSWTAKLKGVNLRMRETLRQIESLLIRNCFSMSSSSLSTENIRINLMATMTTATTIPLNKTAAFYLSQGLLLCKCYLLRKYASYLPTKNNLRKRFLADIRDLEDPLMHMEQKLLTCQRMWKSWIFLQEDINY